jgi:glyoxylase-like metal-dependent hydrolase (beta-lactamase superfamily II)
MSENLSRSHKPLRMPFDAPGFGETTQIAEGVFWARMPMPKPLGHVNVYAFDDGACWTIVDTGVDTPRTRSLWLQLLSCTFAAKPVGRVIVTHHHLDHIGLAGWFVSEHGAELATTRTAYLMARMLQLDVQEAPTPQMLGFWKSCGMDPEMFEARSAQRPFNTADTVAPLPLGFQRLCDGDKIEIGKRLWDIRIGHGHAPEHATFWSRENDLVIGGDQLLGSISPNLGVSATEPDADTVGEWMASCANFMEHATEDQLVLVGHKNPYTGLPARLQQLRANHLAALDRLLVHLQRPHTACGCFPALFRKDIASGEYGLAMVESMAHCVHLYKQGLVTRTKDEDGATWWQSKDTT